MPRSVALIGYNGVTALDLVGPAETFAFANHVVPDAYEILVLAASAKAFVSGSGLKFTPGGRLSEARSLDTIIVPGGAALREQRVGAPIADWLKERRRTRRLASVCTGIYALAQSGLLDGKRATTHWRFAADVARKFPKVRVEPDAIFIRDGNIYTSAGVTAGIDLALAFVEADLGPGVALSVAREMVVYLKRAGGQLQFSEPLQFQARATDRFADLAAWLVTNLHKDVSVESMASVAGLGARHFSRRFTQVFGVTPARYVEQLRMDEARKRLGSAHQTVDSVAASVGYSNADSFRRAFERRFGVSPSLFRGRFNVP
jgi:transcriptional regulator GlxA family with amidase domain